jgi:hypothetical protein
LKNKIKATMMAVAIAVGALGVVNLSPAGTAQAFTLYPCGGAYNYSQGRAYSWSGRCTGGYGQYRAVATCYGPGYSYTKTGGWVRRYVSTYYAAFSEARCNSSTEYASGAYLQRAD